MPPDAKGKRGHEEVEFLEEVERAIRAHIEKKQKAVAGAGAGAGAGSASVAHQEENIVPEGFTITSGSGCVLCFKGGQLVCC
jgi:hypothetical protein